MYFNAASNFNHDFLKLLRKFSRENISVLYLTFVRLLEQFNEVLAAVIVLEVLHGS